jgi:hypothetical protein
MLMESCYPFVSQFVSLEPFLPPCLLLISLAINCAELACLKLVGYLLYVQKVQRCTMCSVHAAC